MIRAGLEAEGALVHAYTSPHLARFHERIRLAGELISEPALTALLDECVVANGPEAVSYTHLDVYKRQALAKAKRWRARVCGVP